MKILLYNLILDYIVADMSECKNQAGNDNNNGDDLNDNNAPHHHHKNNKNCGGLLGVLCGVGGVVRGVGKGLMG